jgi:hypothetical protein
MTARIFRNKHTAHATTIGDLREDKKRELKLWVIAGVKCLSDLMPGE